MTTPAPLRPFFGFYGGKWRDSPRHYPPPAHTRIIEPFAGSAGYSIRNPHLEVILCELDEQIAAVWRYLIGATRDDILSIPDLPAGATTADLDIPQAARWLVGFWLNRGASRPRTRPSAWMRQGIRPGSFWGDRVRNTIADQLPAIRHWQIVEGSYADLTVDPGPATWFIDPPYRDAGKHYHHGAADIDYHHLAEWCTTRPGQVIVCEAASADWLPFESLGGIKTTRATVRSAEAVWIRP